MLRMLQKIGFMANYCGLKFCNTSNHTTDLMSEDAKPLLKLF